jgi:23S rRNA (adenine2503-C2)-methyltransferase
MKIKKSKKFKNGIVYALELDDGYLIETTDTFLPWYTKDAISTHSNKLKDSESLGSRKERWMVGVSTMSGCPVNCKFCDTSKLKKCRNLTYKEIVNQVKFIINNVENGGFTAKIAKEFKINYTRMGEPFLNIDEVKRAISSLDNGFDSPRPIMTGGISTHHYISTIGLKDQDYSWIKDNITLQLSVHSLDDKYRDWLIPNKNKATLNELGQIRTKSNLKTTVNLTLVRPEDFDINKLREIFDPEYFFIKLSPINPNETSEYNSLGEGVIESSNLI